MQLPLNIDTELQVLKLLDSPTFQLPITECLTASELLPINPSPTPHNGIPRALYFPAPDDYLPEGRPACSNCSPPILVILVRLIGWNRLSRLNISGLNSLPEGGWCRIISRFLFSFFSFLFHSSNFRTAFRKNDQLVTRSFEFLFDKNIELKFIKWENSLF